MRTRVKKPPPRSTESDRLRRLLKSAVDGELVAVIGTGVSVALTGNTIPALSWKGLVRNGFAYGVAKGKITPTQAEAWKAQIDSTDLDDLLSAAEFVARKLDAPAGTLYARWLDHALSAAEPTNDVMVKGIEALRGARVPLCTLNYDSLLERVTGLASITINETGSVTQWMRRPSEGILHLHGSWDSPTTCVVGIRDYDKTLDDGVRDLIQRSLGSFKRLLFIGCGDTFADPNFSALIAWLRQHIGTAAPEHYALVVDSDVRVREADAAWLGFVEPIGYGPTHEDLPKFLIKHFGPMSATAARKKSTAPKTAGSDTASRHAAVLRDYRAFLLKDCGQMTIEGIRADMDTAQRRFDLERLFVPVSLLPSPPDVALNDPEREQKLSEWQEKNKDPRPFGEVFAKNKRLALLALPGGGKTLLLKRLAVAYADATRRQASVDGLPDLDLMPVLIRCREWREHIHRPIPTLLRKMPDITGQPSLAELPDALEPLFKKGRALLLVDGLDEIHDDALRTTFVDHLESFLDDHKLIRVVVTSREAGFSLVAPTLARFCGRWRLAPLAPDAISALCEHWHRLMIGDSPASKAEAESVAESLLRNASLRRLAENPLLLTMLLVVKHGAGRLPPDRVSLYGRAVEVLLDTWNIKGHDPLSPKEAVPQLAFVAFQLMREGKQTATETELVRLLEQAREHVPEIRRYAQDSTRDFLKRVELRSSLLVEAGRQKEGGGTVPFYQFRHLTFQEYLAAVAAVEGHYLEYDKSDTVLTPLKDYIVAEEWKEVVPMAAVLARKRAEPLMSALVQEAKQASLTGEPGVKQKSAGILPSPTFRLVGCLVEEAEASQETITAALQRIALDARGLRSDDDWDALCRGPYADDLLHQAWLLYIERHWPSGSWFLNTCCEFAVLRRPKTHWRSESGRAELERMLHSDDAEEIGRALWTCGGALISEGTDASYLVDPPLVEQFIFHDERFLYEPAVWAWALSHRHRRHRQMPNAAVLNRLTALWLLSLKEQDDGKVAFALTTGAFGLPRDSWRPTLTDDERELVRASPRERYGFIARALLAFHDRKISSDEEIATWLVAASDLPIPLRGGDTLAMLKELDIDKKLLRSLRAVRVSRQRR